MSAKDNDLFRRVLDAIPLGIVILNEEDKIIFVNRQAEIVRGISARELLGNDVRDCHPEKSAERVERALKYLHSSEGVAFRRMVIDHRAERHYENVYAPIRDDTRNFAGAVVITSDITDRRNLELERASRTRELAEKVEELSERLHALFMASMESLIQVLEAKDEYTKGHSFRVCETAKLMAEHRFGVSEELAELGLAAKLHDIGKVAIKETVLNKPAKLTDDEFAHVKLHPLIGERILKPIIGLRKTCQVVRHHHERFDGSGYPDGLAGKQIPLGARIIAIADAYDAMTSARAYRPAMDPEEAANEIRRCSGTQFDPELVLLFWDLFRSGTIG